jgi:predicted nucleotidyltransferase
METHAADRKKPLPDSLMEVITKFAQEYDVDAVWLFGSTLEDPARARDVDLAVEGLAPEQFFDFYGELMDALPKPVDLVDLSKDPPIAPIVREEGIRIYER